MKRMLINATQPEELRVAIVDGQKLINLDIESIGKEQKKSNIYKGVVTRIEPSLEAAFVDYGAKRHGFLSVKDVAPEYFVRQVSDAHGRVHIKDVLVEGQELLVQVDKEERGNKGAALTTFISLAGCFLVLVPNNPRAAGISKRVEGEERDDLKAILDSLNVPEGMGLIARTASAGHNHSELVWDLQALVERWKTIQNVSKEKRAPLLIHQESGVIIRSIRDHLREDINEIIIDDPDVFAKTREYVKSLRPDYVNRVKLYRDTVPLFNRFQVEATIESAFQREVKLPSGGSIVIDRTEALVSIDINSSKATKGGDIEETAFNTNLEASDEIARQLRLRDLAGLIVIDFIDMSQANHQREIEQRLREALHDDRARVQVGRISRFGLLEMSRQRLGPTLAEAIEDICHICHGHGTIRGVASLSLVILRMIEEEAIKENTAQVQAQLPVEVATYILNEKRKHLAQIEQRHQVQVIIIPNQYIERPHFDVNRVRTDELTGHINLSYKMIRLPHAEGTQEEMATERRAQPLLKDMRLANETTQRKGGLIKRIFASLFGETKEGEEKSAVQEVAQPAQTFDRRSAKNDRGRHRPQQQRRNNNSSGPRNNRRQDTPYENEQEPAQLSEDAQMQRNYQQKYVNNNAEPQANLNEPQNAERGGRQQRERGGRQRQRHSGRDVYSPGAAAAATTTSVSTTLEEGLDTERTDQGQQNIQAQVQTDMFETRRAPQEIPDRIPSEDPQRTPQEIPDQKPNEQPDSTPQETPQHEPNEIPQRDSSNQQKSAQETPREENFAQLLHETPILPSTTAALTDEMTTLATTVEEKPHDQRQQQRRRQQRPYRGPGRRRQREQQKRGPHSPDYSPSDNDNESHE